MTAQTSTSSLVSPARVWAVAALAVLLLSAPSAAQVGGETPRMTPLLAEPLTPP